MPGWAEVDARGGTVAVALRDFWQQWPKSLEASPEGLSIGLFPRFEEGTYDNIVPWYKYQYHWSQGTHHTICAGGADRATTASRHKASSGLICRAA